MLHIFKKIKCSLSARVFIHRNDVIFIEGEIALREICGHGINNPKSCRNKFTSIPQRRTWRRLKVKLKTITKVTQYTIERNSKQHDGKRTIKYLHCYGHRKTKINTAIAKLLGPKKSGKDDRKQRYVTELRQARKRENRHITCYVINYVK